MLISDHNKLLVKCYQNYPLIDMLTLNLMVRINLNQQGMQVPVENVMEMVKIFLCSHSYLLNSIT